MSTSNSCRIISTATTTTTTVVMLVRTVPSVRARLARSSASSPVPKLTSCSKRLTPTVTTRMSAKPTAAISRTRRPESNVQVLSVRRCSPARGCSPASSKAGKMRTAKTRTNVANPISLSGARIKGLCGVIVSRSIWRITCDATRARRAGDRPRQRAPSGRRSAKPTASFVMGRERAGATSFSASIAERSAILRAHGVRPSSWRLCMSYRLIRNALVVASVTLLLGSAGSAQQAAAGKPSRGGTDHKARQAPADSAWRVRRQLRRSRQRVLLFRHARRAGHQRPEAVHPQQHARVRGRLRSAAATARSPRLATTSTSRA